VEYVCKREGKGTERERESEKIMYNPPCNPVLKKSYVVSEYLPKIPKGQKKTAIIEERRKESPYSVGSSIRITCVCNTAYNPRRPRSGSGDLAGHAFLLEEPLLVLVELLLPTASHLATNMFLR